jgi:hypothetical protein
MAADSTAAFSTGVDSVENGAPAACRARQAHRAKAKN